MMGVNYIHGPRCQAVVFAEAPEEVIARPIEQDVIDNWEYL
jgi:hypothetical protein